MKEGNLYKNLLKYLSLVLLILSMAPSVVRAEASFGLDFLSNDAETVEMILNVNSNLEEIDIELFFSEGLQFVEFQPFDDLADVVIEVESPHLVEISSLVVHSGSEDLLFTSGVLKFNRVARSDQTIEIRDISDDRTYISTYYNVPYSSTKINEYIIGGIDIQSFLGWIAVVLFATVATLTYFIFTTYQEETANQQLILFGLGGAVVLIVLNLVVVMYSRSKDPQEQVLGITKISSRVVQRQSATEIDCAFEAYPDFLKDYILYEREGIIRPESDFSGNNVIDSVDLNYFVDCVKDGE